MAAYLDLQPNVGGQMARMIGKVTEVGVYIAEFLHLTLCKKDKSVRVGLSQRRSALIKNDYMSVYLQDF